jgi:hypothetical protein
MSFIVKDTSWFKSGNEQDSLVSSSPMSQHQTITTPQKEIPSSTSSPPSSPSSTTATYPPEKGANQILFFFLFPIYISRC